MGRPRECCSRPWWKGVSWSAVVDGRSTGAPGGRGTADTPPPGGLRTYGHRTPSALPAAGRGLTCQRSGCAARSGRRRGRRGRPRRSRCGGGAAGRGEPGVTVNHEGLLGTGGDVAIRTRARRPSPVSGTRCGDSSVTSVPEHHAWAVSSGCSRPCRRSRQRRERPPDHLSRDAERSRSLLCPAARAPLCRTAEPARVRSSSPRPRRPTCSRCPPARRRRRRRWRGRPSRPRP